MEAADTEDMFAKQINATTISLPASHASYVSHMTTMLSDPFGLPLIEEIEQMELQ